ncbi:hypothetical protein NPX13_g1262 [Xylaria arbuscula]|uniref:Aspartate aminotransferase family protein n=1 Tax=Xylaria arbuscula TaxID=114810 RepID=A0A9W8NME5_9PEZI|nr:hypothetical protein NPX13_g1262 [Xylaria arbuscula]
MDYIQEDTFWATADKYLMSTGVPYSPAIITKAVGTRLYDHKNREILDFTSGQMSSLLGHSHPEIVDVVRKHVGELDHLLSSMITQPVVALAERLARFLPAPLEKSFFLNTGSETTEAALKMAKMYTGKFEIVAFSASYHGAHTGVGIGHVFGGSWAMIDRQSVGSLAAFIMEPILSTGGILVPPEGYMKRMVEECRKRGMLVIMDEAQTGVGRTGKMFAFEHEDIVPDILCLSKTLGCGLPLGSVSTTAEIARGLVEAKFLWLTTHLNDPLTAAVGNKVLEIVERDHIAQRAEERGKQLRAGLEDLQRKYWCIGDVRGRGLFQAIEIIADAEIKAPAVELGELVSSKALELGLSCNIVNLPGMGGVFRLAPPVTVTADEISKGINILDEAFGAVLAQRSTVSPI